MGLALRNVHLEGAEVGLRASDGVIAELGPNVEARDADEVIDAGGMALVPGLVNAHTHAAMTLFRGFADDLPLMQWLTEHIWPVEKRMSDEDVYWGTRLACVECVVRMLFLPGPPRAQHRRREHRRAKHDHYQPHDRARRQHRPFVPGQERDHANRASSTPCSRSPR